MVDVAKYPFLTRRSGSQSLYYKRQAPIDLAIAKAAKAKDEMAIRPGVFIASAALASSSLQ